MPPCRVDHRTPMDLDVWLIYLLTAIGLSLSPGPNGLLALTHGALHGRRKALYTIFGGALGFVAIIALSMFGIGALLKAHLAHGAEMGGRRLFGVAWHSSLALTNDRTPYWCLGRLSRGLVAIPSRRAVGPDQSQGVSVLSGVPSAVH